MTSPPRRAPAAPREDAGGGDSAVSREPERPDDEVASRDPDGSDDEPDAVDEELVLGADLVDEDDDGATSRDRSDDGGSSSAASSRALSDERYGAIVPADALQRYLAEIHRHPLLDPEEEHDLAVRWHEHGDREAAARLVTANLRLVVMLARRYQRAFRNLLDLIQEGNIGLLEAVKKFDPYRGVRFPSYAVYWIRAYIIRYVMNNWRVVKLGTTQAQRKLFFNLQREKERLEREGYRPDPALIAERLSVKQSEVVEMEQRLSGRDVSVDAPVGDDGDSSILDFLSGRGSEPETEYGEVELRAMIQERIREFGDTLVDKERVIFEERMVADEPKTLQELGEVYGVSRERIRQIEERIKRRLREYLVEHIPDIADVDVRMTLTDRGGS
jgi:RNA polymerase sigma-32 factor